VPGGGAVLWELFLVVPSEETEGDVSRLLASRHYSPLVS